MLISKQALRRSLETVLIHMQVQGYDLTGAREALTALPDSYDALLAFAEGLPRRPMRAGWPYVEPAAWEDVAAELDPDRERFLRPAPADARQRAQTAFLGSVLGCMLGKPLEVDPTLDELKAAGLACGQWPIDDFISEAFLDALGRRHPDWTRTARGRIDHVVADDDIHYTVLGMLNLEARGPGLTTDGVRRTWQRHQNINYTWGPERAAMAHIAVSLLNDHQCPPLTDGEYDRWATVLNPGHESCGALIRADAYGYAFPGRPDMAARLAFTDAGFTHRRTGVYAAMFVAAALALLPVTEQPLSACAAALSFVPRRSRFYEITRRCLEIVEASGDFEQAYEQIHARYRLYPHCHVYQEVGTLLNTLKHAKSVWHGVCLQVMQGNDTDSFGATAGSLLGMALGPAGLDESRLAPFGDTLRLSLVDFDETSLSRLARRMGDLAVRDWGV